MTPNVHVASLWVLLGAAGCAYLAGCGGQTNGVMGGLDGDVGRDVTVKDGSSVARSESGSSSTADAGGQRPEAGRADAAVDARRARDASGADAVMKPEAGRLDAPAGPEAGLDAEFTDARHALDGAMPDGATDAALSCPPGLEACDGVCVNEQLDPSNVGRATTRVAAGSTTPWARARRPARPVSASVSPAAPPVATASTSRTTRLIAVDARRARACRTTAPRSASRGSARRVRAPPDMPIATASTPTAAR